MYDFTRTRPFDEQQIETLRQRLTRMDRAALIRFYNSTLHMCMLTREKPPRAPYLQQLVQAWKEMAQREQISASFGQDANILPALPGIDQEQLPKRAKAPKAAKADHDAISSPLSLFGTGNPVGNGDRPHLVDTPRQHGFIGACRDE